MSSSEWKEYKIKDVCTKIGSGATPRGGASVYLTEGNIKLIRSQNVYNNYIEYNGLVFIDDNSAEKLKNVVVKENDVLLNITGDSVARCTIVPKKLLPARVNQHVCILRANKEYVDPFYLKSYLVNSKMQDEMLSLANNGGTRAALTKGMIENFKIILPNIKEQKAISKILWSLDKKIENNNKINKKLEQMAQAIFKQWFVDFEFPNEYGKPYKSSGGEMVESELGMIPKGWEIGAIGDYVKVKSGFAFKSAWWEESGIPVIKIKDISNNTINFNDISYVSEDKVDSAKDFIVNGGDLLIAMTGATIGKFAIVPPRKSNVLVNQRVGKFFLGENPLKKLGFIYCILCRDEVYNQIVSRGDGSAQPNISPSNIESIKIILPSKDMIEKFNASVKCMFEKIIRNVEECNKLITLRDTLLPKLMSGKIRVPLDN